MSGLIHPTLIPLYELQMPILSFLAIHPFSNGNGKTARLLMNLLLIQAGYPPALIQPEQRAAYNEALATAQTTGELASYYAFILHCIEASSKASLQVEALPLGIKKTGHLHHETY